jgi:hypothetical protein
MCLLEFKLCCKSLNRHLFEIYLGALFGGLRQGKACKIVGRRLSRSTPASTVFTQIEHGVKLNENPAIHTDPGFVMAMALIVIRTVSR